MADEIEEPGAPASQIPAQNPEEPVAVSAYSSTSDAYGEEVRLESAATQVIDHTEAVPAIATPAPAPKSPPPAPPPPTGKQDEEEEPDEEEGMLRMSFMEHLGELRGRILKALGGIVAVGQF